jgi:cytosine/adenosine deaminase-related metal-dependent hydrolase
MTRCVDFARQHGLRMHIHALETWYQREYGLRRWGMGVLDHLDELGVLGPWLTLAHVIWIEPGEARLLAQRGVGVAHNPSSNLRLQSGIAPTAELLGAGVRVGVGLDGQALDDDQDILRELRLAWTLANRPGASSRRVDAERIWEMGTQAGAAITLGPEVSLGRLAPGFLADVVLLERGDALYDWSIGLDVSRSAAEALERLPGLVLRTVSSRHVRHVMINGAWVVRDGHCVGVDEAAIAARLREELAANKATHPSGPAPLATAIRQFYVEWGGPR